MDTKARTIGLGLALVACNATPSSDGLASGGDAESTGPSTAASETSPGSASTGGGGTTDAADADETATPPRPLYDVGTIPDMPELPPGACDGEGEPLSYIWIANSSEHTISKINTQTVVEEGRYRTHAGFGDPSRTSVNLNGNVAVANRSGGLAKFWANPAQCVDSNGTPGIQTSSGAGDVLPFGEDDCMAWSTPMNCGSNRPAAWTRGVLNEATCAYEGVEFWTVCDTNALLLDGDTGAVAQTVALPGADSFAYGGAADADGNFWIIDFGGMVGAGFGGLVRIDYETLEVEAHPLPDSGAYGITVDGVGRPFVCSSTVARFNLDTQTWTQAAAQSGGGGCMYDGNGRVWHGGFGFKDGGPGGGSSIYGFDTDSMELEATLAVPEYTHGISIDAQGYVWGVSVGQNAFRVDPDSGDVQTFSGLVNAYTYSDMTGIGLAGAGGGGTPAG